MGKKAELISRLSSALSLNTSVSWLNGGSGVVFVPVEHEGNSHSSHEEAETISSRCRELLDKSLLRENDAERCLTPKDILVVAPYNLQVRKLRALLPAGVRVGTVDRFQGQEAPVVFISLCHSDFGANSPSSDASKQQQPHEDDGGEGGDGRGLSFVLNQNRLNVALSRAQCLAVVVGSPRLADTPAKTLAQQRQLNFLCRIMQAAV